MLRYSGNQPITLAKKTKVLKGETITKAIVSLNLRHDHAFYLCLVSEAL